MEPIPQRDSWNLAAASGECMATRLALSDGSA
jgi:hypothetical protein